MTNRAGEVLGLLAASICACDAAPSPFRRRAPVVRAPSLGRRQVGVIARDNAQTSRLRVRPQSIGSDRPVPTRTGAGGVWFTHSVRDSTATVYAVLGLGLSLGGCALALWRSRGPRSFYAADVYHMTRRSHRRFAALSAAFAAGFAVALRWPVVNLPLLAVYTLLLILYASSFARGFSGEDE